MPVFTSCKTLNNIRENRPVNLNLCKVIRRFDDVEIGLGLVPTFRFIFDKGVYEEWCFNTTEERDAEFERILTL